MKEFWTKKDIPKTSFTEIGFAQIDERSWVSVGHTFTKIDWRNLKELDEVANIQKEVWGFGDYNAVPPNILAVIEETGGDLLLTRDSRGKAEAFSLVLATNDPQKSFLHMLAVLPDRQSSNIGRKLMILEGGIARNKGVKEIHWTYDPLMGANSQLYIAKLGAIPYKYTVNKYGVVKNINSGQESRYKNVETDRFTVKWDIGNEYVWNFAIAKSKQDRFNQTTPLWNGDGEAPHLFGVAVPYDFTKLSTDEMMDARMLLRKVALKTLDVDNIANRSFKIGTHEITEFTRDLEHSINFYTFSKKSL